MASTWTAAAMVRRAFKAGAPRRKDLILSVDRAVVEAWALCNELKSAMRAVSLSREDIRAALVLLTGDLDDERQEKIYVFPVPDMAGLPTLHEKVMKLKKETNVFPLGVVFAQYDRETATPDVPAVWVQPWLVFQNASRAMRTVEQRYASLPGTEISFNQAK